VDHILLIRHAQTPANALGLMNADADSEPVLTEQGEADARAMAERLADTHLDGIVCTARLRTRRTAQLVGDGRTPAPVIVCVPQLSEIVAGAFAGQPVEEYRAWVRERPLTDAPDGGESVVDAAARYAAGMRVVAGMPHRGLLAVLHNLPLRMIANVLAGEDPVRGRVQRFEQHQVLRIDRERLAGAALTLGAWAHATQAGGRTVTSTRKGR
jgi:broad specificity phosphatase PhoE